MLSLSALMMMATAALVQCQRPSFAGSRPIGYPEVATTEGLADRFGEVDGTTQRLPVEANGDRNLVDRLSKLPIDKQPFWFINWQALEAHRQNPQTYPQKPNPFIDPPRNSNSDNTGTSNFGNTPNSGSTGISNSGNNANSKPGNFNSGIAANPSTPNVNSNLANRNSGVTSNSNPSNGVSSSSGSANGSVGVAERFGGIELNQYNNNVHTNIASGNPKPGKNINYNEKYLGLIYGR